MYRRVIHPAPPPATLPGFHPLIFLHTSFKTIGIIIVFSSFSPPLCQIPFLLCTFEPSNFYGAVPSATALVIAYRDVPAYQPQIARSQLIDARWLGRCGFGCRCDYFDLLEDLLLGSCGT
jgi:hypothetical protein